MSCDEALPICFVRGDRLFDHRVNTRIQCCDAQRRMLKVRRCDNHCIDITRSDELLAVGKKPQRSISLKTICPRIADGRQLASRNSVLQQIIGVRLEELGINGIMTQHIFRCQQRAARGHAPDQRQSAFLAQANAARGAGDQLDRAFLLQCAQVRLRCVR